MSANSQAHPHGDMHEHGDHEEAHGHGTLRGYLIGFFLSVVLTAIPFWLVMGGVLESKQLTGFIVVGFAAVQMIVHMVFFLHMNGKIEGGWTILALIFTLIVVVITLAGSLWVMYHLNANMMPSHDMSKMP